MCDYRSLGRFPEKEGTATNFWSIGRGEGTERDVRSGVREETQGRRNI